MNKLNKKKSSFWPIVQIKEHGVCLSIPFQLMIKMKTKKAISYHFKNRGRWGKTGIQILKEISDSFFYQNWPKITF